MLQCLTCHLTTIECDIKEHEDGSQSLHLSFYIDGLNLSVVLPYNQGSLRDALALNAVQVDPNKFKKYLQETHNTICGRHPIGLFLHVSPILFR